MSELAKQLDEQNARKLCAKINAGIEDTANLILQLYMGKGWAAIGYTSWRECCQEEFGRSASWACRQIKAAMIRDALPIGTDLNEAQARELRQVPADKREAVLGWAKEKAGEAPLTAAAIRKAAEEVLEAEPDEDTDDPDEPAWEPGTSAEEEADAAEPEAEAANSVEPMPFAEAVENDVRKWIEWYKVAPYMAAVVLENLAVKIRG